MRKFWDPFTKIADGKALIWGLAGLAVSITCASFSGWHAHGLLNFGPAPRDAAWISSLEYFIIWLVPSAIFYGLGAALSSSRIRPVDIFGTTAFALMPLAVMNLSQLVPGSRTILNDIVVAGTDMDKLLGAMARPLFIIQTAIMAAVIVMLVIWLFNAVKVSCNLKGGRLWTVYLAGLVGGDFVCRLLIRLMY